MFLFYIRTFGSDMIGHYYMFFFNIPGLFIDYSSEVDFRPNNATLLDCSPDSQNAYNLFVTVYQNTSFT